MSVCPVVSPFTNWVIFKAFVLIGIGVMIVIVGTFIACAVQPEFGITKTLFEVVSAFSTTGLTMGITGSLNIFIGL